VPFPKQITQFNRDHINQRMETLAKRAPLMAVVHHKGRTTGRAYSNPVLAFHDGPQWMFALTYGRGVDWVRNVMAAGGCSVEHRGRRINLSDPVLHRDASLRARLPLALRPILAAAAVDGFLTMSTMSG
jgi:deazaflavin-dependent oxidoreductase (nitroreductase family)